MPEIFIDGKPVRAERDQTVIEAARANGIDIPAFCWHPALSIAGNCRVCAVQVEGRSWVEIACNMPVSEGLRVLTDSDAVRKYRKSILQLMTLNHPVDCGICDKAGECMLQDYHYAHNGEKSMSRDPKVRSTKFHPLSERIVLDNERCILCSRCVRFTREISKSNALGIVRRGDTSLVRASEDGALDADPYSDNVVDLCPVGALVSKPYSFEARPWELRKTPGIDVMDAVGTNIRIDSRGREVMRVLPRINEEVNEEWAHDKTRHAVDGLLRGRLDQPWVRKSGKLKPATWEEAFAAIAAKLKDAGPDEVAAIAGALQDVESIYAMKALLESFGSKLHECREDGTRFDVGSPGAYRFAATIAGIEEAGAILLVGTNPRWEAPLVNTRIRKAIKAGAKVFHIGPEVDLTYPVEHLGTNLSALAPLPDAVRETFRSAANGAVIVGSGALVHVGACSAAKAVARGLGASFNILHMAASRVGALDLGFSIKGGIEAIRDRAASLKAVFLLGADGFDTADFARTFTVYIGSHGDNGVRHADVILPAAAYTEKHGTYVNLEGRVQFSEKAVDPPGQARTDWTILRALSDVLGKPLPFNTLSELRAAIGAAHPHLVEAGLAAFDQPALPTSAPAVKAEIVYPIDDFYLTNPIARASPTLQRCSAEILHGQDFAEAAE